jgi:hypothetical protein
LQRSASIAATPDKVFPLITWCTKARPAPPLQADEPFVSMDRMVGSDFEAGLTNLKALAEKR